MERYDLLVDPKDQSPLAILRRFGLWLLICTVSAAPSFIFAHEERFNDAAMVVGVVLFAAGYTAATSTARFLRLRNRPFVRRTMYIGYGLRLLVSVIIPVGFFLDLIPGMLSVGVARSLTGDPTGFIGTLIATLVQGTLLNIILGAFMLVLYALQRALLKHDEHRTHGFEVVIPAAAVAMTAQEESKI